MNTYTERVSRLVDGGLVCIIVPGRRRNSHLLPDNIECYRCNGLVSGLLSPDDFMIL